MYEKEDRREVRGREGNGKMLLYLIYHTCKCQLTKWKRFLHFAWGK